MSQARYHVLTWDANAGQYTEQDGMEDRSLNLDRAGLRRALRELRERFGYECRRYRLRDGLHVGDRDVLVERVDCPLCDELDFGNREEAPVEQ